MKRLCLILVFSLLLASCTPTASQETPSENEGAYCLAYTPQGQVVYDAHWTGEYPQIEKFDGDYKTATFALGCFWGPAAHFAVLDGVLRTRVGYTGGTGTTPSYENLGNHIEVIEIDYDPAFLTYEDLVTLYFTYYDATVRAYSQRVKSVIFYRDDEEQSIANNLKKEFSQSQGKPIFTEIDPLDVFYLAEDRHQLSYLKKETSLYDEVSQIFTTPDKQILSILASKLNGYIAGYGKSKDLTVLLQNSGLSDASQNRMRAIVDREN
ncbi:MULTISPECIES: peptide-methionine (S)-S-oxide reductase [unclassified Fusibacter]|uniref:peptide-methionine (S)-S-oxide reductase n=1 Tax=unclassified Fusibacter TaxID=2624464 RepID=UPI001012C19B|nr:MULTISPECIES: peptide-methionine (S)-S-oxide reductase [unclassified Fusibacter]MCK8058533.1 peptide-methionine (S)-S-oxide reductase [Fusibacter sp. A2]NPE22698.1 peptide-methionine (S)-S-oxide reductase [Fusibacter sp. A1]RXV60258.1 peptide-methionine (S)-S-oxide reductase [Fusibacter sp. A1]